MILGEPSRRSWRDAKAKAVAVDDLAQRAQRHA
jgi:hypothetical protein